MKILLPSVFLLASCLGGDVSRKPDSQSLQNLERAKLFSLGQIPSRRYQVYQRVRLPLPAAEGENLSYSITPALPKGLVFNHDKRLIEGIVRQGASSRNFIYRVENGDGQYDIKIFSLDIVPALLLAHEKSVRFLVYIQGNPAGEALFPASILQKKGGGSDGFVYSISPKLPAGLNFDSARRVLSGTPVKSSGSSLYTYKVENKKGDKDRFNFYLQVLDRGNFWAIVDQRVERGRTLAYTPMTVAGKTITVQNLRVGRKSGTGELPRLRWDADLPGFVSDEVFAESQIGSTYTVTGTVDFSGEERETFSFNLTVEEDRTPPLFSLPREVGLVRGETLRREVAAPICRPQEICYDPIWEGVLPAGDAPSLSFKKIGEGKMVLEIAPLSKSDTRDSFTYYGSVSDGAGNTDIWSFTLKVLEE